MSQSEQQQQQQNQQTAANASKRNASVIKIPMILKKKIKAFRRNKSIEILIKRKYDKSIK